MPKFHEIVAGMMALTAEGVVAYVAIVNNQPEALGALVAITAAGTGFFLRGKVLPPSNGTTMPTTATTVAPSTRMGGYQPTPSAGPVGNPPQSGSGVQSPPIAPAVPPPAIPDPAPTP